MSGSFSRLLLSILQVAVLASSLAACSNRSVLEPTTLELEGSGEGGGGGRLKMQPNQWTFMSSVGMPAHPQKAGGGWRFDFPNEGHVDYLVTDQKVKSASQSITAVFAIDTVGNPFFDWRTESSNNCPSPPATIRLFVQRRGDDLSGVGPFEFYRWWSNPLAYQLGPGDVVLTGDLTDPSKWSSVLGQTGATNVPAFRAALADIGNIGFTFGGGCFFGHGVFVTPGSGEATFTATEYSVK